MSELHPTHLPRRRSVFADRLREHASFAFGDEAICTQRGRWAELFRDRIGPAFCGRVIFEIGCADGDLICRLAAKHPTTAFIGLDWKAKSIFDAAERVARLGLRNVVLLRGRGQEIRKIFAPGEIDEVLLFHPDPCDTPAERANRLFDVPFLLDAHAALRGAASTLTLKTDHPGYYTWALALLGRDEPAQFKEARDRAIADPASAGRLTGEPRVRATQLLSLADRPPASGSVRERFEISVASADLWRDEEAASQIADRVFAIETTFFEKRFLKKKQPIHYLQLKKR